MGNGHGGKGNGDSANIHTASYNLDFVSVSQIVEQYRSKRSTEAASEVRNPVNQYGLVDGKAIFFQQGSGSVPTSEMPSLLQMCRINPNAVSKYADKLDPLGTGFVEEEAFVKFFTVVMTNFYDKAVPEEEIERSRKVFKEKEYKRYILRPHPAGATTTYAKQDLVKKGRKKGLYGTPLHFVCMRVTHTQTHRARQIEMVEYLLANGAGLIPAKADSKKSQGTSAFEIAEVNGNTHLLPYLKSAKEGREFRRSYVTDVLISLDAKQYTAREDVADFSAKKAHNSLDEWADLPAQQEIEEV